MILIVVKFPVRPEYSDQWLSRVADFTLARISSELKRGSSAHLFKNSRR